MSGFGRRQFMRGAVATTGGVLVGGSLEALIASVASAAPRPEVLEPVADLRDGIVRLHPPRGFPYRPAPAGLCRTSAVAGASLLFPAPLAPKGAPPVTLQAGTVLPGRHDGMGAF